MKAVYLFIAEQDGSLEVCRAFDTNEKAEAARDDWMRTLSSEKSECEIPEGREALNDGLEEFDLRYDH
jgi:hypothetical protein